jgi:2-methylcitrate dehydratase PrpD
VTAETLNAPEHTAAGELGAFVAGTGFGDVPPAVLDRARRSLLDLLGVAVCGSVSESAAEFGSYVRAQRGVGEATVIGGASDSAFHAAVLNGTYAHATELSETFNRAVVHPGNVVIPAALAVAEREHRSGRELLSAIAVGYEVLVRTGLAAGGPRWMMSQGYHPPSALGPFGAAAAAAALRRLDAGRVAHALGVAACLTPSTLSSAFAGATVKELFEGYAAGVGIMAADLAATGITGPGSWPVDWFRAVVREPDPEQLTDGLGQVWRIASGGLRFKVRAVAAMATPTLDAVEDLLREHRVDPAQIAAVVVESAGRVTIGAQRAPRTLVAARASVPFLTAYALVRREEFLSDRHLVRSLGPEALADAEVLALAERVELVVDERIDREFETGWPPKFAARVRLHVGGDELVRYHDSFPATSDLPFDEVAAKFRNVTADVLDPAVADTVVAAVAAIEECPDVAELMRHLRSGRP